MALSRAEIVSALARNQRETVRVAARAVKHTETLLAARRKLSKVGHTSPLGLFRAGVERLAAFKRDRAMRRLVELDAERTALLAARDLKGWNE